MRKVSELIRLAVENPLYLNGDQNTNHNTGFLCNVVEKMPFTKAEKRATLNAISAAIGPSSETLFGFMIENYAPICDSPVMTRAKMHELICSNTCRQRNDLRVQFWAVLCMDLVRKGL
ncbi:hypothetical protein pf16_24 [Pseudomonas phage pf16]|uniref:Uncharacterized protein n=1 Tax=Pseudomonas phage pf16 TaxID=1815630 RepID=A0A1S5R3H6_9CAUD|nr:hypothetical protein FDG98_gp023 [Pseudomonas phage pf16]AND74947.1 hypothetical protein pf16_24 [Pseudomonas phage pf16]